MREYKFALVAPKHGRTVATVWVPGSTLKAAQRTAKAVYGDTYSTQYRTEYRETN